MVCLNDKDDIYVCRSSKATEISTAAHSEEFSELFYFLLAFSFNC